jgi:hypothetical protein
VNGRCRAEPSAAPDRGGVTRYPSSTFTCRRAANKLQDWNELVVAVKGGTTHCTCSSEVLEAEFKLPTTGPIGLEGDRGQMEYRRIQLQEQP